MGFLLGRKGLNETDGRHRGVAKKSAAVLAAVAVAGGSAVGVPEAEAALAAGHIYWEKVDQDGKPLGGASFTLSFEGETYAWARERAAHSEFGDAPTSFGVIDNVNFDPYGEDYTDVEKMSDNPTGEYLLSDLDPRPGHFLVADPLTQLLLLYNTTPDYEPTTQSGPLCPRLESNQRHRL